MSKQVDDFARPAQPKLLWDVVLIPAGTSQFTAGHFHQLAVSAENDLGVRSDEAVQAHLKVGWVVAEVVPQGRPSSIVAGIRERARRAADEAADPRPANMRGPADSSGLPYFPSYGR